MVLCVLHNGVYCNTQRAEDESKSLLRCIGRVYFLHRGVTDRVKKYVHRLFLPWRGLVPTLQTNRGKAGRRTRDAQTRLHPRVKVDRFGLEKLIGFNGCGTFINDGGSKRRSGSYQCGVLIAEMRKWRVLLEEFHRRWIKLLLSACVIRGLVAGKQLINVTTIRLFQRGPCKCAANAVIGDKFTSFLQSTNQCSVL